MKRKKRLLWQIYLPFLAIIFISLFLTSWHASRTLRNLYTENQVRELQIRSQLIEHQIMAPLLGEQYDKTDSLCKVVGEQVNTRFTLILPSGRIVGDTHEDPPVMDNHADRPEVREAFSNKYMGVSTRFSYTLNIDMLYVAIPVEHSGKHIAVVRSAKPLKTLAKSLNGFYKRIGIAGFIITALSAMVALLMLHRINKPISEMIAGAKRFGRGELEHRLYITQSGELRDLAEAMNQMAIELDDRIRKVTQQRNEIQAILSSMVEAIVVVDIEEHIKRFNHAAGLLFDINEEDAYGKNIREIVRNSSLMNFVIHALSSENPQEKEIHLSQQKQILQAHGTAMCDEDGRRIGALIVLNDITRLRRLESVRQDFVANVSHELKTPITSIKGFVETLQAGALNEPENADRFLKIISKQTDRLNAIIEDLLKLSNLERDEETPIELTREKITQTIEDAVLLCRQKADKKDVHITCQCSEHMEATINAPLLEEAMMNLLDNAIKFSNQGGEIDLSCIEDESHVLIRVRDWGTGIEQKQLPRIFERFYRIDKARRRELGGTGLGLAIVKHIAQVHHGHVTVESILGEGSTFTLCLPKMEK